MRAPNREQLLLAARHMDWEQVALNHAYGPPCFHFEADTGTFCGRAKGWHYPGSHKFVGLESLLQKFRGIKV